MPDLTFNGTALAGQCEEFDVESAAARLQFQQTAGNPGRTILNLGPTPAPIWIKLWLNGYSSSALCQAARASIDARLGEGGTLVLNNGLRNETYNNVVLKEIRGNGRIQKNHATSPVTWCQHVVVYFDSTQ